jgi:ABC-type dipeptide/oligopeptide/nickel transport system ATPase subunit
MKQISVTQRCPDYQSYRAACIKSLFNADEAHSFTVEASLPVDEDGWQIGLIVGPSGSGKSTLGRKLFGPRAFHEGGAWPKSKPIIDVIAPDAPMDKATAALSAVGLGSVPSWLRPFHVLSTGEKFRAELARIVCEAPAKVVIDEFTSVVDRQIARIGASAFAKAWRKTQGQAVLLSCHYDIIEWLCPDWILDIATGKFTSGRGLQRPSIELDIFQTNWRFWPLFEPHHYLKLPHMIAATNYVGFVGDTPVAHVAVSTRPGLVEARACRLVVMPEWQGAGVGLQFLNAVCDMWRKGQNRYQKPMRTLFHTSHPALAKVLRRHPLWCQVSANLYGGHKGGSYKSIKESARRQGKSTAASGYGGHFRAVQGFRYMGEK